MRKIQSRVPDVMTFHSSPGSRIHERYEPRFNGKTLSLKLVGTEDIQDMIEAHAPYTDMNYMLSRLRIGDTTVLRSSTPLYGDFSRFPSNPIDAINTFNVARDRFTALPADVKAQYNNDYRIWLAQVFFPADTVDKVVSQETTSKEEVSE